MYVYTVKKLLSSAIVSVHVPSLCVYKKKKKTNRRKIQILFSKTVISELLLLKRKENAAETTG